jgi:hypothetical protein
MRAALRRDRARREVERREAAKAEQRARGANFGIGLLHCRVPGRRRMGVGFKIGLGGTPTRQPRFGGPGAIGGYQGAGSDVVVFCAFGH